MKQILKYLLFLMIGIIICILVNRKDRFSIGMPWCIKSKNFRNKLPFNINTRRTFLFDDYNEAYTYFDNITLENKDNFDIYLCGENNILLPLYNENIKYTDQIQQGTFSIQYVDVNNNTLRIAGHFYPTYFYNPQNPQQSSTDRVTYFVPLVDIPFGTYYDPLLNDPRTAVIGTNDAFTKTDTYVDYNSRYIYDETSTDTYLDSRFRRYLGDTRISIDGNYFLKFSDRNIHYFAFLDPIILEFMRRLNINNHTIPKTIDALYNRSGYIGFITKKVPLDTYDNNLFIHCYPFDFQNTGFGLSFYVDSNYRIRRYFNGYYDYFSEDDIILPNTNITMNNISDILRRPNNLKLMLKWMLSSICLLMISSAQCFFCWNNSAEDNNLYLHTIDATSSLIRVTDGAPFRGGIADTLYYIRTNGGITLDEYKNLSSDYINRKFRSYDMFMFCNLTCGFINFPLFTKNIDVMRRQFGDLPVDARSDSTYDTYLSYKKDSVIELNYEDLNEVDGNKLELVTELFNSLLQHLLEIFTFIDELILIYNDILLHYLKQYFAYRYKWLVKLRNDMFITNCIDLSDDEGNKWSDPDPPHNNCRVYERHPSWCNLRADAKRHCCACNGGQRFEKPRYVPGYIPIPPPPTRLDDFFESTNPLVNRSCSSSR